MPEPIIKHVYQAAAKVLKDPATAKRLANEGAVPVGNTPDEFGAFVRTEIDELAENGVELKVVVEDEGRQVAVRVLEDSAREALAANGTIPD